MNFQFASYFNEFSLFSANLAVLSVEPGTQASNVTSKPFTVKDFIGDGFLWAVPKFRRSLEKRQMRKFGSPGLHEKLPRANPRLRECDTCGDFFDPKSICATCYDKVRQETNAIKDKIMQKIGLKPHDKEVVVLYDGEEGGKSEKEFWNGKRIVEMEKPRPIWFSKNLLQKSTKEIDTKTKTVKPDELG